MSKVVRELHNYFATVRDLASGALEWMSRPSWLEFAPNNVCNLRCVMCAQADGLPVVAMKREEARRVLGEVLPNVTIWAPSALSEPLLADFKMVLQECRKHDVYLNMYTNATLTTGEKFREMADRVHKLHISFDSHVPEVLTALRVRADYEKVVANIKEILEIAAEQKIPIGFVVVLMKDTLPTLPDYVDFIADIGGAAAQVDIRCQPMLDNAEACEGLVLEDAYSDEEICAYLDRAGERAMERKINLHVHARDPLRRDFTPIEPFVRWVMPDVQQRLMMEIQEQHPHFCYMAALYLKIEPNGDVFPCCRGPEELKMGNTYEQSIDEIWNGEPYRKLRARMHARDYPEPCQGCDILMSMPKFQEVVAPTLKNGSTQPS